ncbi:winged helix-turn-helix domain-containing protein [Pseudoxanthomonas sp. J35]|uniref:winged helix-turn-helix domain-containing protein n=1 Tax=Pseudoxanthomonas sp. J35 TaxID=935852 RepID=UPI00048B90E5|nr:winged helix-turn-helix domain-containing protein [Pseudoxanthomonas sp. J35]
MKPEDRPADAGSAATRYRFDGIVVDVAAHTVVRDGQAVALEPKAFAVLVALLRRPGELLGRDELLDQVWGHRHVTPGVLTRAIAQLRAALGDDPQQSRYILTRHALGYCFIGVLEPEAAPASTEYVEAGPATEPARPAAPTMVTDARAQDGTPAPSAVPSSPGPIQAPVVIDRGTAAPADPPRLPDRSRPGWVWGLLVALLFGAIAWFWRSQDRPPVVQQASIAVLPFTTLSDDRDDRYFAEGLSVELLNALSGVHGLTVAAWRPPEAIDRSQDVRGLGQLLGVATVLDASVRRDGPRLRISARLSDTRSGYTLWSRNYDGDADTIFDTQTDIANAVVDALLDVLPGERESLQRRLAPTRDAAAFGAYLVGLKQLVNPRGEDARGQAAAQFRKALEADAGFARAQAALCRMETWNFESNHNPDAFESARLACLRAMNMDGSLGEVKLALGDLARARGEAEKALEYYDALLDDPALRWQALAGRAQVHVDQGREDEAMHDFRQALLASPGNAQVHADLGYQQYRLGHYPQAIASYRTAVSLRPDDAWYWSIYGGLLLSAGDDHAAEAALRRSLALEPNEPALSNLGTLRFQRGDYAGAADLYRRASELNPGDFFYVGFIGDALDADPATAAQARALYVQAAALAQRYVDARPDDAKALAVLGWFRAQLGEREAALRLGKQARALGHEPGEVAVYNALALAVLGLHEDAARALQDARKAGIPESRIATQPVFRRTGLVAPRDPAAQPPAAPPAAAGPPRGEPP